MHSDIAVAHALKHLNTVGPMNRRACSLAKENKFAPSRKRLQYLHGAVRVRTRCSL